VVPFPERSHRSRRIWGGDALLRMIATDAGIPPQPNLLPQGEGIRTHPTTAQPPKVTPRGSGNGRRRSKLNSHNTGARHFAYPANQSVWLARRDWESVLAGKAQDSIYGQTNSSPSYSYNFDHHFAIDDPTNLEFLATYESHR
jgi:hypothetical protein